MTGRGPTRLSKKVIVDACLALLEEVRPEELTLRRLGTALGVDPTAVYRHFRDKDELLRAVGDRVLEGVLVDLPDPSGDWRAVVEEILRRLRAAHLARPDVASLVRSGPPRHDHELRLTEALLHQLDRAGLPPDEVALAYHALIELTVGSAALDAELAAVDEQERRAIYAAWRRTYAVLDTEGFPHAVATAAHLYAGTADERFEYALARLLDGIAHRSPRPVSDRGSSIS